MNSLIISAVGSDRLGIVSEISGVITSHGGNVEESRMSRLGSDFAIIMLVSVDPDWVESLEVALQSINELTIISKPTKAKEGVEDVQCQIDLSGADNEGIVKVLSKVTNPSGRLETIEYNKLADEFGATLASSVQ